jgi:hypothetical protein
MARTVLSYQNTEGNLWPVLWPVFKILREIHGPYCVLSYQNAEGNLWPVQCSVLSKY